MTKAEHEAFTRGFEKAKAECIQVIDEWSRACHPVHPKKMMISKDYCWQNHGLKAAKRSIKRDVRIVRTSRDL